MEKIIGLSVIAIILIVAWIFGKKKTIVGIDRDSFEEIPEAAEHTHLARHDKVSGRLFKRKYPTLPRREFFRKRNEERKERHWMRVYEYRLRGILWTSFGLYWMNRKLAEEHAND